MVHDLIKSKIESLERCVARISQKVPSSKEILESDIDLQDIIIINLERAVQLSSDMAMIILSESNAPVPATMGEAFEELVSRKLISPSLGERMKKAVGFRNLAVHAYTKIDWTIVWKIIKEHLDEFRQFAEAVYNWKP
ncbi:MAG: DUF86 domain-containing protein [Chitinivibrionales bacterium]|nr:DUF86 domain-containing protein [Chitinivibrionales bacterium]